MHDLKFNADNLYFPIDPNVRVFGLREEARDPRENPRRKVPGLQLKQQPSSCEAAAGVAAPPQVLKLQFHVLLSQRRPG